MHNAVREGLGGGEEGLVGDVEEEALMQALVAADVSLEGGMLELSLVCGAEESVVEELAKHLPYVFAVRVSCRCCGLCQEFMVLICRSRKYLLFSVSCG